MMPIAPLMIEHRLIERMIRVIGNELARVETGQVDPEFIDMAVDFIRNYTDRCHHGKEEDILFRDLQKKQLSPELKAILGELIEEHRKGRMVLDELVAAKVDYIRGNSAARSLIANCLRYLVEFYPKHIEKEDQHFFLPCMKYFTQEEKDAMLQEEFDFDTNLIHSAYKKIVEHAEQTTGKTK